MVRAGQAPGQWRIGPMPDRLAFYLFAASANGGRLRSQKSHEFIQAQIGLAQNSTQRPSVYLPMVRHV